MSPSSRNSSFTADRINSTTFLIIEDDSYSERPRIYALLHPRLNVLVLSDTGCDSPRQRNVQIPHLRTFLEEVPIPSNNNKPLNPGPNQRAYVILCSHCHYDHIGGIEQFCLPATSSKSESEIGRGKGTTEENGRTDATTIIASRLGKQFIEQDLPTHSLCKDLGIRTPVYKVSHWAEDFERLRYPLPTSFLTSSPTFPDEKAGGEGTQQRQQHRPQDLGITILQSPGHTPDSLTWYDHLNRTIYIGDTAYSLGHENMAIMFPAEGDWSAFMTSLVHLLDFVLAENAAITTTTTAASVERGEDYEGEGEEEDDWLLIPSPVKLSAAHTTTSVPAAEFLGQVISFFEDVIAGRVRVEREWVQRGEVYCSWSRRGQEEVVQGGGKKEKARFAVQAPRRLCEAIRKERGLNGTLKNPALEARFRGKGESKAGTRCWGWR